MSYPSKKGDSLALDSLVFNYTSCAIKPTRKVENFDKLLVRTRAVEFNIENKMALFNEIYHPVNAGRNVLRQRVNITGIDPNLWTLLKRTYIAIDAYLASEKPVLTLDYLIGGIVRGPEFATELKRVRFKSYIKSCSLEVLEKPDWWKSTPSYQIDDIGQIFNYNYCFHWKEDCNDLFENGFSPVKQEEKTLEEYRDIVRFMFNSLPEISPVDPRETLLEISTSSSLSDSEKTQSRVWEKEVRNSFSKEPIVGKRSIVQVGPANTRDSIILPSDTLNTVSLIEKQMHHIVKHFPENMMIDNPAEMEAKLSRLDFKFPSKYCRDITKEGITKPRNLIQIILEEGHLRFPDMIAFDPAFKTYSDLTIIDFDGKLLKPTRGHGLGMANSLTTFMQIAVFRLIVERMTLETPEKSLFGAFYNDDATIFSADKDILAAYIDFEEDVFYELSLIRNPKKSFWGGYQFFFCEIYFPEKYNRKDSYVLFEVLNTLSLPYIWLAKAYINSLAHSIRSEYLEFYLSEIINHFGWEFSPLEVKVPYRFGGWFSDERNSVNFDFLKEFVEGFNYLGGYKACAKSIFHRVKSDREGDYLAPIFTAIGKFDYESLPEEVQSEFLLGTRKKIEKIFWGVCEKDSLIESDYSRHGDRRKQIYFSQERILTAQFMELVVRENPHIDFIINSSKVVLYDRVPKKYNMRPVFEVTNPRLSALKFYKPLLFGKDDKNLPNPIPLLLKKKKCNTPSYAAIRERLNYDWDQRSIELDDPFAFKFIYVIDSNYEDDYIDPQTVIAESERRGIRYLYPNPFKEAKKDLVSLRNSVMQLTSKDLAAYPPMSDLLWKEVILNHITPDEITTVMDRLARAASEKPKEVEIITTTPLVSCEKEEVFDYDVPKFSYWRAVQDRDYFESLPVNLQDSIQTLQHQTLSATAIVEMHGTALLKDKLSRREAEIFRANDVKLTTMCGLTVVSFSLKDEREAMNKPEEEESFDIFFDDG